MESDGGRCLGYVVRNPFNDKVEKAWLLPCLAVAFTLARVFRHGHFTASFRRHGCHLPCCCRFRISGRTTKGDGN